MTIDELLAAAGLTANDEIPIWNAEATGEPTKKITAQNLATAVVALANLVTGIKGDAEQNYRHGDVNITPANIGAVSTIDVIGIPHGGTGATQGTIDITNQCTWNVPTYSKYLIYNPYLKMVFGSLAVYGNVANQAYLVTLPSSVPIISKGPCGICTSATSGVSIDVSFEGRNLQSSHSVNVSVSEPRYIIQAYVG